MADLFIRGLHSCRTRLWRHHLLGEGVVDPALPVRASMASTKREASSSSDETLDGSSRGGSCALCVRFGRSLPVVMMKRWSLHDPIFKGEAFEWARFQSMPHCQIAARHLNAAKVSERFFDDFGGGDYSFDCKGRR